MPDVFPAVVVLNLEDSFRSPVITICILFAEEVGLSFGFYSAEGISCRKVIQESGLQVGHVGFIQEGLYRPGRKFCQWTAFGLGD